MTAARRWSLRSGDEDLAVFETTYRARVTRCDLADGDTLWFEMPRGTTLTVRRDHHVTDAATYKPKMRGGIVRVGERPLLRLRPSPLGGRWALRDDRRTIMAVDTPSAGTLTARLTEHAATEADLSLLVTLSLTAVILERSVPRLSSRRSGSPAPTSGEVCD